MRIAILTPTYSSFSGPDRVVDNQARTLRAQGHNVLILTLEADMAPMPGIDIIILGMPQSPLLQRVYRLLFFLDFFKIRRAVRLLARYDQIISHMYPMTLIAQRAKRKYGIHYQYYNMGIAYPHLFRNVIERAYMRAFLWLTCRTVRGADSAISISQFLQKELEHETGVRGGVELCHVREQFNPRVSGIRVQKKYQLTTPVILFVGRLSPHKGVHLLIMAFRDVQRVYTNATLLIVGKPTFEGYLHELRTRAAGDPHIVFVGFVQDKILPLYYGACDVYATATLWEGFNLPLAESQACGKPVVAFDIGAHPEVVKNGILVPAGNVHALANAIVETLRKIYSSSP